jgi:hypothetical protein
MVAVALTLLGGAACGSDHGLSPVQPSGDAPSARGQVVARNVCALCHGADLRGATVAPVYSMGELSAGAPTPDLNVVLTYTPGQFDTLLITGMARDGRVVVDMLGTVAVGLAKDSRQSVYKYLVEYVNSR